MNLHHLRKTILRNQYTLAHPTTMSFQTNEVPSEWPCSFHPSTPDVGCLTCSVVLAGHHEYTGVVTGEQSDCNLPSNDHSQNQGTNNFRAPIANMSGLNVPVPIKTFFFSRDRPAPFTITATHDYYSDRFALSPIDRPKLYVGNHYGDQFALSPVKKRKREDAGKDHLEPLDEEKPKKARRGRPKKQIGQKKDDLT